MSLYCLPEDVKKLINTDLSDDEIAKIIKDATLELDDMLQGETMNATTKYQCIRRLAAIEIAQNQRSVFQNNGNQQTVNNDNVKEWKNYVKNKITQTFGRWTSTGDNSYAASPRNNFA
jgi:ElaB/YqjD/DUF883 family membrane-anchored ribosome-binding protein